MNWKNILKWLGWVVLVVAVVFSLFVNYEQGKIIEDQNEKITNLYVLTEEAKDRAEATADAVVKLAELGVSQQAKIAQIVDRLNGLEGVEPTEAVDLTPVQDRIDNILAQIEQLEKDKLTTQDFDKYVEELEKLVNNSLVELSKPPTVPPVKPMPGIQPVVQKVALSNAEKAAITKMIKKEVFKQFEQAGYGKFEGEKFILKKGFFGARLYPKELENHKPVSPYTDDFNY
jgi:hypothetical protein